VLKKFQDPGCQFSRHRRWAESIVANPKRKPHARRKKSTRSWDSGYELVRTRSQRLWIYIPIAFAFWGDGVFWYNLFTINIPLTPPAPTRRSILLASLPCLPNPKKPKLEIHPSKPSVSSKKKSQKQHSPYACFIPPPFIQWLIGCG
jgi:hypothetical protein